MAATPLAGCSTGKPDADAPANAADPRHRTPPAAPLRIPLVTELIALDPALLTDINSAEALMNVYEGLVRIGADNKVEPVLAERWAVSDSGRTYTFTLRNRVKFHGGRGFVADDVKYSWERALDPRTQSPIAANYLSGVVGVSDVIKGNRPDLTGVEVLDALTLRVRLEQPMAYFLAMLAYPTNWVVCKERIEATRNRVEVGSAIGTGPFVVADYTPGRALSLRANPNYWAEKAKMAAVEYPVILNMDTVYNNFEAGDLDLWDLNIPASRYASDKQTGHHSDAYHVLPQAQMDYLVLHPRRQPVFAKPEVRRAFAQAIDRERLLRVAYSGAAQIAHSMVPPGIPYSGSVPAPIRHDPAEAKRLLASAGYPGGKDFPALTLTYTQNDTVAASSAQLIRDNLREAFGIGVDIREMEFGARLAAARKGELEFYLANWIADYPDPQNFLSTLLMSDSPINRVGYASPKFDNLCRRADVDADPKSRAALYAQANATAIHDVALLPIAFPRRLALVKPTLKGWQANVCTLLPHARTYRE